MNSNKNVAHIKARFNEDIRRFQCPGSWSALVNNLHELFSIPKTQQLAICYRDEENDICSLSSQIELDFAISHSSPLQLVIRTTGLQVQDTTIPVITPDSELPSLAQPCKGRRGAKPADSELPSRGQPCKGRRGTKPADSESLRGPAARLIAIQNALANPNLPSHRVQKLTQQKARIEQRLKQQSEATLLLPTDPCDTVPSGQVISDAQSTVPQLTSIVVQSYPEIPAQQLTPKDEARLARLNARLKAIQDALEKPDLPPHLIAKLTAKKSKIEELIQKPLPSPQCGLQARLDRIETALENPHLPAQKRENMVLRKSKLESLLREKESNQSAPETVDCDFSFPKRGARCQRIRK